MHLQADLSTQNSNRFMLQNFAGFKLYRVTSLNNARRVITPFQFIMLVHGKATRLGELYSQFYCCVCYWPKSFVTLKAQVDIILYLSDDKSEPVRTARRI
jgi:hypothetical protein